MMVQSQVVTSTSRYKAFSPENALHRFVHLAGHGDVVYVVDGRQNNRLKLWKRSGSGKQTASAR